MKEIRYRKLLFVAQTGVLKWQLFYTFAAIAGLQYTGIFLLNKNSINQL